jgi:hypothetical protein
MLTGRNPRGPIRFKLKRRAKVQNLIDIGIIDTNHGGKPCGTHARAIKGREYFLPLGKRCEHTPQIVLLENFPC